LRKSGNCSGSLSVKPDSEKYFAVFSNEDRKKYAPFFTVELSIDELNQLSRTLGEAYELWIKTLEPTGVRLVLDSNRF